MQGGKLSHINAVAHSISFINFMEKRVQPVDNYLDSSTAKQIDENRHILKSIFKCVIFCAQQNIALHGHRDDAGSVASNKGNFLALLQFRCDAGDSVLKSFIDKSYSRYAYTSKNIQNEVIIKLVAIILLSSCWQKWKRHVVFQL